MKIFKIVFLLIIFFTPSLQAKSLQGFMTRDLLKLENKVRADFSLSFIAKKISEVKEFSQWPEDLDPHLKLYVAVQWFDQGFTAEASQVLAQTVSPNDYRDLSDYYNAMALLHLNRAGEAAAFMERLSGRFGDDSDFLFLKSIYQSQTNDLPGAIATIDQVIERDKDNGKAYLQRALYHLMAISHDLAIKDLKRSLAHLSKHDSDRRQHAMLQLGLLYLNYSFDEKKAERWISRGIALNPHSVYVQQVRQSLTHTALKDIN